MDDDVPEIVSKWYYGGTGTFQVMFFNGCSAFLDIWAVREFSCKGYTRWDQDADDAAIRHYVDHYRLYDVR